MMLSDLILMILIVIISHHIHIIYTCFFDSNTIHAVRQLYNIANQTTEVAIAVNSAMV
jgi:hypothetical protein